MAKAQRLILASGSSGRRELLSKAGYEFEVMPSGVDEPPGQGVADPRRFVQEVAWSKATAVAAKVEGDAVILAADSIVWRRGAIVGKPADEADARRILSTLSGTTHELWTGVVLWRRPDDLQVCWQEASRVRFKALSARELSGLIATGDWAGKSGGYGIQADADPFITIESGSFTNVVGLPMESLARFLPLLKN
jgi:septum formation protein